MYCQSKAKALVFFQLKTVLFCTVKVAERLRLDDLMVDYRRHGFSAMFERYHLLFMTRSQIVATFCTVDVRVADQAASGWPGGGTAGSIQPDRP